MGQRQALAGASLGAHMPTARADLAHPAHAAPCICAGLPFTWPTPSHASFKSACCPLLLTCAGAHVSSRGPGVCDCGVADS